MTYLANLPPDLSLLNDPVRAALRVDARRLRAAVDDMALVDACLLDGDMRRRVMALRTAAEIAAERIDAYLEEE